MNLPEIKREINDESLDVDAFVTMTADLERYKNQLKALEEKATSRAKIEMAFKKAAVREMKFYSPCSKRTKLK